MSPINHTNRVLIITGGTGGVGQAVTLSWLHAGASVLVVSHSTKGMNELCTAWEQTSDANSQQLGMFVADVSTQQGADQMVAEAERLFGQPADTLLHLVGGFGMMTLLDEQSEDMLNRMININFYTAFYCFRAMIPAMKKRGGGWLLAMGARAALQPGAMLSAYAASKAALIALIKASAEELRTHNVRVNAIAPSTIDTPANRKAMGDDKVQNWVTPDDIAHATHYLCSEQSRAVTGVLLELYANA